MALNSIRSAITTARRVVVERPHLAGGGSGGAGAGAGAGAAGASGASASAVSAGDPNAVAGPSLPAGYVAGPYGTFGPKDVNALAAMMAGEAGNQGINGMAAVGHVGLNRFIGNYSNLRNNTLAGQISAPNQFLGYRPGTSTLRSSDPAAQTLSNQAISTAKGILNGTIKSPVGYATDFNQAGVKYNQQNNQGINFSQIGVHTFFNAGQSNLNKVQNNYPTMDPNSVAAPSPTPAVPTPKPAVPTPTPNTQPNTPISADTSAPSADSTSATTSANSASNTPAPLPPAQATPAPTPAPTPAAPTPTPAPASSPAAAPAPPSSPTDIAAPAPAVVPITPSAPSASSSIDVSAPPSSPAAPPSSPAAPAAPDVSPTATPDVLVDTSGSTPIATNSGDLGAGGSRSGDGSAPGNAGPPGDVLDLGTVDVGPTSQIITPANPFVPQGETQNQVLTEDDRRRGGRIHRAEGGKTGDQDLDRLYYLGKKNYENGPNSFSPDEAQEYDDLTNKYNFPRNVGEYSTREDEDAARLQYLQHDMGYQRYDQTYFKGGSVWHRTDKRRQQ